MGLDQDHFFGVPGTDEQQITQGNHPHGLAGDDPLHGGKRHILIDRSKIG
jgi:hypothetical protein